jgi:cell division septation protein DedD
MDRRVKERLIGATILVALIVLIAPELLSGPRPAPLPPLAAGLPSSTRNVSVNLATSKATPQPQVPAEATGDTAGERAAGSSASGAGTSTASGVAAQAGSAEASAPRAVAPAASAPRAAAPRASGTDLNVGAPGSSAVGAPSASSAPTEASPKAQESAAPLETTISSPKFAQENAAVSQRAGLHVERGWAVQLGSFASKAHAEKLLHQLSGSGFYLLSSGSGPYLRYRVRMGPLADRGAAERAVTKLKAQGRTATIVAPAS